MEFKPPPDINALHLWKRAVLYTIANPTVSPAWIAMYIGISKQDLGFILRSVCGKVLLRRYRATPPANIRDFRLEVAEKTHQADEIVRTVLSIKKP